MAECEEEVPVGCTQEDSGEVPTYWHDYRECRPGVERVWLAGGYLSHRGYRRTFGRDIGKVDPGPALRVADWIKFY